MRLSSIVIAVSLVSSSACSKKEDDNAKAPDPKVTEAPLPQLKKPVDSKPLPPLAADTGGTTGKVVQATTFGGLGIDAPRDIAISSTGDAYVAGYFDDYAAAAADIDDGLNPLEARLYQHAVRSGARVCVIGCGTGRDLLPFVADAAIAKQGKFMPGSHIPILAPEALDGQRPDYLVILPWNIAVEVKEQYAHLAEPGTKFVTAVPKLEIT